MDFDKTVQGGRAAFFQHPESDRLLAIIVRLLTEHSVLSERVKTLEALLEENGVIAPGGIEAYQPTSDQETNWAGMRMQLIKDVLESGANIPIGESD